MTVSGATVRGYAVRGGSRVLDTSPSALSSYVLLPTSLFVLLLVPFPVIPSFFVDRVRLNGMGSDPSRLNYRLFIPELVPLRPRKAKG